MEGRQSTGKTVLPLARQCVIQTLSVGRENDVEGRVGPHRAGAGRRRRVRCIGGAVKAASAEACARGRAMVGYPDVEAKAQLGRVRPAMSSHAAHRRANDRME